VNLDFTNVPWVIVLVGLEFPAVLALVDCSNRPAEHFEGGADDRKAWVRWLVVAVLTMPILVGSLILVAYYQVVVRRQSPTGR
jgi:hypothetical protein